MSLARIFATFRSVRSSIASFQGAGTVIRPGRRASLNAAIVEAMSPTIGASIGRLLSISIGSTPTWTNLAVADQRGGRPRASSQFSRAPTSITTSACPSARDLAAAADWGWSSGSRPLAIDIGGYGMPVVSTNDRIAWSARA